MLECIISAFMWNFATSVGESKGRGPSLLEKVVRKEF